MINRISTAIVLTTVFLISASTIKAEQSKEQIAIHQAKNWLSIVDSGKYDDSWGMAAIFFKNAVSKEQWIDSMNAYRVPLGKMVERKLKNYQYATSLPGTPDGECCYPIRYCIRKQKTNN